VKSKPPSRAQLQAICFVLSARISALESQLRTNGPGSPPAADGDWTSIKAAMADLHRSHAGVRKLIRHGRLDAMKIGGRVLVSTASIAAVGAKKPDAHTDAPPLRCANDK
jgi:hypothetical protein